MKIKNLIKNFGGWFFLLIVVLISAILFFIKPEIITPTLKFFFSIFRKILLIFVVVFLLLFLVGYFISSEKIKKYFGKKSGFKAYFIAVVSGLISHGPIYMWYPFLSELKKKGVKDRFIAIFLYNRAIKIPILPLMIFYFGLRYVVTLTAIMITMSIFNGLIVEKFTK